MGNEMADQSKIGSENDSNGLEDRRCHVQAAKAGDVELLDAYSLAIETVAEAVAPAVVSIVTGIPSRDEKHPVSDGRNGFGSCR